MGGEDLAARIAALEKELATVKATDRISSKSRHDLLSPLNAIIGFTGILLDKATTLDERQKKNLHRIKDAGTTLTAMLRALSPDLPPVNPPIAPMSAFNPTSEAKDAALKGRGGTILVVDDVESIRELLRQDLEARGYHVETAASGEECLKRARECAPNCIILDIEMPGLDGLATCRLLKQDAMTMHVPVLFLTGHAADEALAVMALAAGGNDFLQKPYAPSILLARVNSQVAIHEAQTRLLQMVMTDELTGVFSRRFLFESLRQQLRALTRSGPPSVAVLLLDVDHFKNVNDTHGHLEGDSALRRVAATVRRHVRGSDVVARFGGEEFVVVLMSTRIDGAMIVAEKLRESIQADTLPTRAPVTVSIGVSARELEVAPGEDAEAREQDLMETLLREADEALYRAKEAGRNKVLRFEQ